MSKLNYDIVRPLFGGHISESQLQGMEAILALFQVPANDFTDLRFQAYGFATVLRESGATMQPIEEWGKGLGKSYYPWYGRGYIQLTWKYNYVRFSPIVKADLVKTPALALRPDIAGQIMVTGMTKGLFTGKKLSDYFNSKTNDPMDARRIINGMDDAQDIAEHYQIFLRGLAA